MNLEIKGIIATIVPFNWEEKMVSNAFVEKVTLTKSKNGSFRITRMKGEWYLEQMQVDGQVW